MSGALRRKNIKKGITFTFMVVGSSGLGKTSLINTLCDSSFLPERPIASKESVGLPKTLDINLHSCELEEDGIKISTNIIDTPGFGDNINNDESFAKILDYIEAQYDEVLLEETRIKRNPRFQDNRVHCLIYMITPTGHALKELDIEFIRRLGQRVNIIPVIAKADSLTPAELAKFKQRIAADILHYKLPIFEFPYDPENDDEETINENKQLRALLPFSVICAEGIFNVGGGRQVRGRQYPWGISEVDNVKHCDFSRLRYVLFSSHLQDLKDVIQEKLYEDYRTQKLIDEQKSLANTTSNTHESSSPAAEQLREQVASHVMMKEDLLKREEAKIRELELKVQRDLESRRMELVRKEKSLKEIEDRISNQSSEPGN